MPREATIPRGPGTALFTGGGWLLPGAARQEVADSETSRRYGRPEEEVLILSDPSRVLVAHTADEVPALLEEIGTEQTRGRYVAGYVAYEAGAAFGLTVKTSDPLPLAWAAVYPQESARRLPGSERRPLLETVDASRVASMVAAIEPELSVSKEEFVVAIERIRELIAAGDTYQVNYTVRARFDLQLDPLDYFLALILRQPVPYAAYLDMGDAQILSLSPELFLRRRERRLESMPMKGTRPRADDPAADAALAQELIHSEKDRAENLMIVDMVRNDLGRVSRAGSIQVPALYSVEPYRTVWQMASTVTGRVRRDATPAEIFAATFPGASITGAPKHHTMEIIADLETEPRGVYTGTVGLFLPGGDFTCNLAIRTLVHRQSSYRLGVGAGMVWDSDPLEEYEETLTKATFALPRARSRWAPRSVVERVRTDGISLFETILLEGAARAAPGRGEHALLARYRHLGEHLDRMETSAGDLLLAFDRGRAQVLLADAARENVGPTVVRLELSQQGELQITTRPVPPGVTGPVAVLVSPFRTDPGDRLLAHKTTARHLYDHEWRRAQACGCQDALFLNYLGRVTEGAIRNIFVRFDREWLTPPVADGLLPGVWRAAFLRETAAQERSLSLDDLFAADEIVIGNSVRGATRVDTLVLNALDGLV
jgi:para-aminobenzoate synthetase / 4-amino-4-deoxychorismate lyase